MTEEAKTQKRSVTGNLVALAVVAILIIAPFGSYFYLKGGLEYRLESLDQLKEKEITTELREEIESKSPFTGNARFIYIPGGQETQERELLHTIDQQIVDRSRFEVISFSEERGIDYEHDIQFVGSTDKDFGWQFMMIDTSNVVRSTYAYHEGLGKELIRHLSVVVPVPTSRSVNLNREDK